jgi:hypothetical protein
MVILTHLPNSQLDVSSTIGIISKAISAYTQKESEINPLHLTDMCSCVEVISILLTINSDHIWSIFQSAKIIPIIANLYRICSSLDKSRNVKSNEPNIDVEKMERISNFLTNIIKLSLKKDNHSVNLLVYRQLVYRQLVYRQYRPSF